MKDFVIELEGAYTNSKEVFARVVLQLDPDDYVLYRDFGLSDGEPIGNGRCHIGTFLTWAARPLTHAEQARLRWDKARERDRSELREILDRIPDELILAEYRRRGLDRH